MNTLSKFCQLCKALKFDDSAFGGYAAQDEDGHKILKFDEDDRRRQFEVDLGLADAYPDFPLLSKSSVDNGCDGCRFLADAARKAIAQVDFDGFKEANYNIRVIHCWGRFDFDRPQDSRGLGALVLSVELLNDRGRCTRRIWITYYVQSSENSTVQRWLGLDVVQEGDILTSKTISWIQSRLKACQRCDMLPSDSFIPTRLIRVDHDMQSLVEMNEQTILAFGRDSIKYAALSYCWGPVEKAILQLTTEKNSVKDRTSGIMETEMTSVLRGAVTACRALSIPFLWVDALCIIQDDTNDWEQESSLMGRIYTNAYLTLCALSSESCTGDFLERRTTAITVPFQSSIGAEFRGAYSLTPARYGKPESIISSDVSHSRWSERGWTLQEEFLSKRMLAFGQFGLHFMCSHGHQTQHRNIQPNPYSVLYHRILNEKNNSEVYIEWHESIVIASSTRRLTRPTDRFPSISSLAACFNEKLHDTYVAGLWQNELYKGLYWVIAGPTLSWAGLLNDIVTPTSYVAPSWSWASRQSYIYFGGERFSTYGLDSKLSFSFTRKCDAAAAEITLANAHYPYGRLSHAVLTIKTRVQKLSSEISMKEEEHFEYSCFIGNKRRPQMMCTIDWKLRQDGEPLRKTIPENVMLMLLGTARQYIRPLRNRFSLSLRSRPVSAIPKNEEEDDKNVEDEVAYGLLIYKLPGTDDFIRVGTFYSRAHDDWGMRLFEDCGSTTISLV